MFILAEVLADSALHFAINIGLYLRSEAEVKSTKHAGPLLYLVIAFYISSII
jgi:hypothetical protein